MWSEWRKSSRSNGTGACVEVSVWRKSSRSNGTGSCVEMSVWRKSKRSNGAGAECVEVALSTSAVRMRDSKNAAGPVLGFAGDAMTVFLSAAKRGDFDSR